MALCPYCGKKAGFLSKYHETCFSQAEQNRKTGLQSIKDYIAASLKSMQPPLEVQNQLNLIASQYKQLSQDAVLQAVLSQVDELSRNEPLEKTAAEYLRQLCENLLGKLEDISHGGPFYPQYPLTIMNLQFSKDLWGVMQGYTLVWPEPCGVVLQPGEFKAAEFGTVLYQKSVMVSSHSGSYNGMGVRVASGVYYRFGGYAGHALSTAELQNVDAGFLVLTNRSIYFGGQQETFRIPYSSIIRFKAYPAGLGFFRGAGAGREEIFTVMVASIAQCNDLMKPGWLPENAVPLNVGWFLYNLVTYFTAPKAVQETTQ